MLSGGCGGGGGGSGGGTEEAEPPGFPSGGENEAGGEERGGPFGSGNRWPRQETLALLKIRSDMDAAFRDSSSKGPLWEDISRKLAELGYHRSGKKCKEKFENVYKYHKRTREGRTSKQDGKTYRFFDQLEAFDNNHPQVGLAVSVPPQPSVRPTMAPPSLAMPVTLAANTPIIVTAPPAQNIITASVNYLTGDAVPAIPNPKVLPPPAANPSNPFVGVTKDPQSDSTSSSTFSDEGLRATGGGGEGHHKRKRKRKWKDFFERLMKEVMDKQEQLQTKFLEAIERREHERLAREESWRMQEMARINREREILAQERSMAAAKDTAVMAFLQKIAEQQPSKTRNANNMPTPNTTPPVAPPPPAPQLQVQPVTLPVQAPPPQASLKIVEFRKNDNGDSYVSPPPASSSRWPKIEVETLIRLRTNLDSKYQENVPKGPLWEEISSRMRKLGYERSSKRCKEKWENINKYFKKVKESNKKRRDDSKTCPYFEQLDAIYKERSSKIMDMAPLMVTPEQQWPPQQDQSRPDLAMDGMESDPMDQNLDDDHDDRDDDDEEDDGGEYELVAAAKPSTNGDAQ